MRVVVAVLCLGTLTRLPLGAARPAGRLSRRGAAQIGLSGLLAMLGLQLYLLGSTGSINLPYASPLVKFGQIYVMPAWFSYLLAVLPGAVILWLMAGVTVTLDGDAGSGRTT